MLDKYEDSGRSHSNSFCGSECNGMSILLIHSRLAEEGGYPECLRRDGRYTICDFCIVSRVVFLGEEY